MSHCRTSRDTSSRARPFVGALVLEQAARIRLRSALGRSYEVRCCERGDQLRALAQEPNVTAIVAEPRDSVGARTAPVVEQIRGEFASLPVIAYLPRTLVTTRDILDMARAGVCEIVRAGIDDEGVALQSALASAGASCTSSLVRDELRALVAPGAWRIISFILDRAMSDLPVREISQSLGISRRTLSRRLRRSGLPPPRAVVGWSRLLMAARLLEDHGRTLENVALSLDFPSASALRNMLWRYTGLRPVEIRQNGGFRCLLHLLRGEIACGRGAALRTTG